LASWQEPERRLVTHWMRSL